MRNTDKSKILWSFGGIAASIGAIIYLYRKKKQELNDPINILRNCMKQFYILNENQFMSMNKRFDKIIDYFVVSHTLKMNQEEQQKDSLISYCKNKIQSEGFYECLTCDINKKESQESNLKLNYVFSVNQYCPDCFDRNYHKDHDYRKRQYNGNIYCDCGNQNRIPKVSFCKNHCGVVELKEENKSTQDYQAMKKNFINLFKESFYFLIDKQSEFLYEAGKNNSKKQIHFNYLLTVLIEKIQQLISEGNLLTASVCELLSSPIGQALRVDASKISTLSFLKEKQIDDKTSILEYLVMLYKYVNQKNDELLFNLLSDLSISNSNFNEFLTEKLLKLIKFQLFMKEEKEEERQYYLHQTQIFKLCIQGLQDLKISKKILKDNPQIYNNSLKYVYEIFKNITFSQASEYRLIYTSSVILSLMVQVVSIYKTNFQMVVEYALELVKLHSLMFDKLILTDLNSGEGFSKYFLQQYPLIFGFFEIQKILLNYFNLFVTNVLQNNTAEQIDHLVKIISHQFEFQIQRIYEVSENFIEDEEQDLLHTSVSLFPIFIYIILLKSNNSQDFSLQNLKTILENPSCFSKKNQLNNLISMMLALMKNNLFSCFQYPNCYWRWFLEIMFKEDEDFQAILGSYNSWTSTENKLYDHFMLTYQILYLLVEDQEQNLLSPLVQKFIEKPKQIEEQDQDYEFTESYYLQIFFNSCLFDQTPFLNIISQFRIFQEYSNQEGQEQVKIDFVLENIIKQVIQFYKGEIKYFSDLKNCIRKYVQIDDCQLENLFEKILLINKETDKFQLKEKENQINYYNLGRSFCSMSNFENDQLAVFQGLIQYQQLDHLFQFQQQLLIKFFSDSIALKYFIQRIELGSISESFSKTIFYLHSYILVFGYIIKLSENNSELFQKKQIEEVQMIKEMLYNKDNFELVTKAIQKNLMDLEKEELNQLEYKQLLTQTLTTYQIQFSEQSQMIQESEEPQIQDQQEEIKEKVQDQNSGNVLANSLSISNINIIYSQDYQAQESIIQ